MAEVKKVELNQHGNYIYGTLDGTDYVGSGIIQETKKPYQASVKLKFIIKSTVDKDVNGVLIPVTRASSQTIQIKTMDEHLPKLALKYNDLLGKDLLINYCGKNGDMFVINEETDIISLKS